MIGLGNDDRKVTKQITETFEPVQLFLDESPDSQRAVEVMNEAGKPFSAFKRGENFNGCDFPLPALFAKIGTFKGLREIEIFAKSKLTPPYWNESERKENG